MAEMYRACIGATNSLPCSDGGRAVPGTSRCANHTRKNPWNAYKIAHPDRSAYYASGAWKDRRAAQLHDFPDCAICGQPAKAADHIKPLAEGGAFNGPLQSLCRVHHAEKTRAEAKRGVKRAAARRKQGDVIPMKSRRRK